MAKRSTAVASVVAPDVSALVAERAYFKAERRGFAPGHEIEDWLAAERELVVGSASKTGGSSPKAETVIAKPKKAAARKKNGSAKKPK